MEDSTKFWLAGAGLLVGAIAGAAIWAQRAAAIANAQAQKAGEDALMQVSQTVGAATIAAALQGAFVGGLIGLIAVALYLYFSDPDREMTIRAVKKDPNG